MYTRDTFYLFATRIVFMLIIVFAPRIVLRELMDIPSSVLRELMGIPSSVLRDPTGIINNYQSY